PWPTAAAAVAAGFGAGMAASAVIHSKPAHTNGAPNGQESETAAANLEVNQQKSAQVPPGKLAAGFRWLAGGLAAAGGEALFAATRKQLEAALAQPDSNGDEDADHQD